ncbi:hypothetical protein B0H19DRAFT_1080993 [Mycena capillaripes]|nr:hypothetical protein B0H19DRAFT_1080993 [Mycena capillaripes]
MTPLCPLYLCIPYTDPASRSPATRSSVISQGPLYMPKVNFSGPPLMEDAVTVWRVDGRFKVTVGYFGTRQSYHTSSGVCARGAAGRRITGAAANDDHKLASSAWGLAYVAPSNPDPIQAHADPSKQLIQSEPTVRPTAGSVAASFPLPAPNPLPRAGCGPALQRREQASARVAPTAGATKLMADGGMMGRPTVLSPSAGGIPFLHQ